MTPENRFTVNLFSGVIRPLPALHLTLEGGAPPYGLQLCNHKQHFSALLSTILGKVLEICQIFALVGNLGLKTKHFRKHSGVTPRYHSTTFL